ncbi:MAG: 50S ribosomal protein L29 [Holosporales bacterium]|jgi:large subunit ribosomal protein L29
MKLRDTKPADLRQKTPDELRDLLLGLKKEQFNLRFRKANAPVQDTVRPRWVRRHIARIQTVLGEKQAAAISVKG